MDVFVNTTSLRKLVLSSNGLLNFTLNSDVNLDNLTFLDIRFNMLRELNERLLEALKNLKTL